MKKSRKVCVVQRAVRFRQGVPALIMANSPELLIRGIHEWNEDAGKEASGFVLTGIFDVCEGGKQVAFGAWLLPNVYCGGGPDGHQ